MPFEVVNIDIISKIETVPLRSLMAKATCRALLDIFKCTGIPNVTASDLGQISKRIWCKNLCEGSVVLCISWGVLLLGVMD